MSDPDTSRHKRGPELSGCGGMLLVLLGLVLLLPGACVIANVYDDPRKLFAPGAGVAWTFLMVSAAGVALLVVMARLGTRR